MAEELTGRIFKDTVQQLIDSCMEMVMHVDKQGYVIVANSQAKSKLEYKELTGVSVTGLFPTVLSRNIQGDLESSITIDGEAARAMAYRSNQTCFLTELKIASSRVFDNSYTIFATDISVIESLEKQLAAVKDNAADAGKVKDEFVANVTHELRTPVNGIQGNTKELLTHDISKNDRKLLELIERGCEDMHTLINSILDFSKLEAGKFQLDPREFVFRDMMEYVKSNHINKIREKGLDFFMTISPDIPETIIGDDLRIAQILNNLLSNATKFTSVGKIMVEAMATATKGNRIELYFMVVDSGIGIDKNGQDKLFKSFSQVEASTSRRFGGTGLGLNISKQLVELMGGSIGVESELGKGSVFSFSVWLEMNDADAATTTIGDHIENIRALDEMQREASISRAFGSKTNLDEIAKRLTKLQLCLDMETWEKAENFTDAIKQLTDGAPHEIKTAVLRLKMAVQKGNYEKSTAAIEEFRKQLDSIENK